MATRKTKTARKVTRRTVRRTARATTRESARLIETAPDGKPVRVVQTQTFTSKFGTPPTPATAKPARRRTVR